MSVEIIGVVAIVVGLVALYRGPSFGIAAFVPATLLGASGAILLGGSGTIQPAHLLLGFVLLAVATRRTDWSSVRRRLRFPHDGFWLLGFTVFGVGSAFVMPRLFSGATSINAIGSTGYGPSLLLVPLGPTSGNMTQSVYIVADTVCFFICSAYATSMRGFRVLARAALTYCVLNVGFAVLDLVTYWTNTAYLLNVIRNADYQFHVETVVTGLKRIVGSFPETSSFAYATLGALGFATQMGLHGVRPRLFLGLGLVSLVLLAFSTSSTAYVATPVVLLWLYASASRSAARGSAPAPTYGLLLLAPLALGVLVTGLTLSPRAMDAVRDTLTVLVFDKSSSQSGMERAQWNLTALQNVVDTYGFGGGLGSIRASSFPVALLSNGGIVGTVFFVLFLLGVLAKSRGPQVSVEIAAVRSAARAACIGFLAGATVSGALVDLGLPFFVFAALAGAEPRPTPDQGQERHRSGIVGAGPAAMPRPARAFIADAA